MTFEQWWENFGYDMFWDAYLKNKLSDQSVVKDICESAWIEGRADIEEN